MKKFLISLLNLSLIFQVCQSVAFAGSTYKIEEDASENEAAYGEDYYEPVNILGYEILGDSMMVIEVENQELTDGDSFTADCNQDFWSGLFQDGGNNVFHIEEEEETTFITVKTRGEFMLNPDFHCKAAIVLKTNEPFEEEEQYGYFSEELIVNYTEEVDLGYDTPIVDIDEVEIWATEVAITVDTGRDLDEGDGLNIACYALTPGKGILISGNVLDDNRVAEGKYAYTLSTSPETEYKCEVSLVISEETGLLTTWMPKYVYDFVFTSDPAKEGYEIFSDVSKSDPKQKSIGYLYTVGPVRGYYEDGATIFRPDQEVTRAEFIKMIMGSRMEAINDAQGNEAYEDCFTDVQDQWFAPYACYAKKKGWVDGYDDGSFGVAGTITRAEAFKIIVASDPFITIEESEENPFSDVEGDEWYAKYAKIAYEWELLDEISDGVLSPADTLTRADVAQMVHRFEQREYDL